MHRNLNVHLHVCYKIINRICVKVVIAQNDTDLSKIKPFNVTKCFTKGQHGKFQIIKHINYNFSKVSCYDFNVSFLIILWRICEGTFNFLCIRGFAD